MIPWIKGLSLSGGSRGETRGTRPTPLFLDQTEALMRCLNFMINAKKCSVALILTSTQGILSNMKLSLQVIRST